MGPAFRSCVQVEHVAKLSHMSNELLTVKQAAEALSISRRAVLHRIAAGTLAATKLGAGTSAYVIAADEIERVRTAA